MSPRPERGPPGGPGGADATGRAEATGRADATGRAEATGGAGGPGPLFVGVIGSGGVDATHGARHLQWAEEVGAEIAARGAVLVCGGLGGVMEAACRGATGKGGLTVGILPGEDRRAANRYVRVPVPTGLGELRNGLVVRASDALIAIGGAYGTLSEVALALRSGRGVVGLDTWSLVRPGGVCEGGLAVAATPREAVELAVALSTGRS